MEAAPCREGPEEVGNDGLFLFLEAGERLQEGLGLGLGVEEAAARACQSMPVVEVEEEVHTPEELEVEEAVVARWLHLLEVVRQWAAEPSDRPSWS